MSKLKLGIIFRAEDGKLILMKPREKEAGEISDFDGLYTTLPSHQAEIVDVIEDPEGTVQLRSHFCQSFFDDKKVETPAHKVIKFIMEGDEKREEWITSLEEEINQQPTEEIP